MSETPPVLLGLLKRYPLPLGWRLATTYLDSVKLCGKQISLVGLVAEHEDPIIPPVTASAGSVQGDQHATFLRAYFELLERVAILEALRNPDQSLTIFRSVATAVSEPSSTVASLFPQSPEPQRWNYAKSNGVSAHTDREQACWHGYKELLEREIILRSWYGNAAPQQLELPALENLVFYEFDAQAKLRCVGAFMRVKPGRIIHGFALDPQLEVAARRASDEVYQRWGFLLDEISDETFPVFSPGADFHQDYYLSEEGSKQIDAWLAGSHESKRKHRLPPLPSFPDCYFADLTPASLQGSCFVIKAFHPDVPPLIFGHPPPEWGEHEEGRFPHPIV